MTAERHHLPRRLFLLALALGLAATGCGRPAGPPPITPGAACAGCGMAIEDLRFACEAGAGRRWKVYDDIICLLRDAGDTDPVHIALADYDSRSLHRADSVWVVKGSFPTPMSGGLAAFLDRGAAEAVAAQTSGRVDRLGALVSGAGGTP